jgi:hypothetical protein
VRIARYASLVLAKTWGIRRKRRQGKQFLNLGGERVEENIAAVERAWNNFDDLCGCYD